ncbi:uncharacterized protein LOC130797076 [Amaranthus tricolor]|uniref:uncharacterized protein LOC130797076 n=1 Tax=Amaranthus tricolor TaxID=29722 RepID=UPI002583585C|nr:uncharacterized protein LOC130797076 [Amaranthus tricolor]
MAPPRKPYISIFLLSLFALFIFTHYSFSPPSLSNPTTHFLSPQNPTSSFTFTIKVLAFNRLSSLSRCLNSLSSAHYFGDTVNLHIFIDHFPNTTSFDLGQKIETSHNILDFVDGFRWDFGQKLVHYRTVNMGLQAQWLEAWWPSSDDEFVFVVEDDLEVSPLYYKFIKGLILTYYYNQSNFSPWIYGASLQRPRFVPGKHGNKINLDSGTRLFLYQLVGTWGQVLFPRPWKEFRLWYDDHKAKGIKPVLEGMVTTGWYKRMGERIWTPWFIKFIHARGYFNIYTNFLHERALSVSHRDTGVNYGKTAGPDSQLLDENAHDINILEMQSLSNLQWYDFCFKQILPGRAAKKLNEIGRILDTMGKQKPILLISLSKSSEEVIRNLICHFERLNIQNYIFIVPNSKSDLLLDLPRRGHPMIVIEEVFDGISVGKKSSSELIKEITVISYVIKECLDLGFGSWVMTSNTLPLVSNPQLDSTNSIDDFYVGKSSSFFFVRSSSSSRRVWHKRFLQKFAAFMDSFVHLDSSVKKGENFVDFVEEYAVNHDLRLKIIDEIGFTLKLERVDGNQTLPTNTKMISWSPGMNMESVHKHLEELGLWIIDDDSSCRAVICHHS